MRFGAHAGPVLVLLSCLLVSSEAVGEKACGPLDQRAVLASNLTGEEAALLPHICWQNASALAAPSRLQGVVNEGIPAGVSCEAVQWCDGDVCTRVCKRGSVVIDPWLQHAVRTQLALARRLPLCLAALLGSHNSGITLADGYGNADPQYQAYFRWLRYVADDAELRTSNQWLSLTDQLRLGVRALELDTHWVEGELRIAHCGGLNVAPVNRLIDTLNLVARLLGHPLRWDTQTVGCQPSLSSLPVARQRSLRSALAEIRAWLDAAENVEEVLVLFLDDQADLLAWGKVPELMRELTSAFPLGAIYSPSDHAARGGGGGGGWPSLRELRRAGKRVLVVSAAPLGGEAAGLIFDRGAGEVCSWTEPSLRTFEPYPECALTAPRGALPLPTRFHTLGGTLLRVGTCELRYGPFNCEFLWEGTNAPLLDEGTLPAVTRCGVSQPCPDSITPERVAATIWSWAPGEPAGLGASGLGSLGAGAGAGAGWSGPGALGRQGLRILERWWRRATPQAPAQQCAAVSRADGRWRAVPCDSPRLPLACRGPLGEWAFSAPGARACPGNSTHALPAHAKDNAALQDALAEAAALLPLRGPDWLAGL